MDKNLKTFRELDGGREMRPPDCALAIWYASVRDTAIHDMTDFDIARSCRQKIYPDEIVPEAIKRLIEDQLSGDLYDGELLFSLRSVDRDYWKSHPEYVETILSVADIASNLTEDPNLIFIRRDLID